MSEQSLYRRIIAGEAGAWAAPIRGALGLLEFGYARIIGARNRSFDRRGPRTVLPIPVVSVGNLTVGGTGKTPLVIDLVQRLDRMGLTPVVVSRGYGAAPGEPNDEERVIRRHVPGVVCLADPDRARAGETARERFGADVIVLDDGFQHRCLGRTLDIVVIDATSPFGYGRMLPRGLLREPVQSLRRAGVVVLSRCDQVSPSRLLQTEERVRRIAPSATVLRSRHRVDGMARLDGTPDDTDLTGKRAVVFAGIGHPRAFLTTVQSLGADVVAQRWWPDHHRYKRRDMARMLRAGRLPDHDVVLTTEKDAAKLAQRIELNALSIRVVRVAVEFLDDGDELMDIILERALSCSTIG